MASTRRLTFAIVKSDGSGTTGGPRRPAWAIEEHRSTECGHCKCIARQCTAAAEVEPARRKVVSVKVELGCNCSRESAQVEREHMHLIE